MKLMACHFSVHLTIAPSCCFSTASTFPNGRYLVSGKDGKVVKAFEPPQSPLSIENDIKALL